MSNGDIETEIGDFRGGISVLGILENSFAKLPAEKQVALKLQYENLKQMLTEGSEVNFATSVALTGAFVEFFKNPNPDALPSIISFIQSSLIKK